MRGGTRMKMDTENCVSGINVVTAMKLKLKCSAKHPPTLTRTF